jgi:cyclopropane-fatty-acyl-phospholipid synthase
MKDYQALIEDLVLPAGIQFSKDKIADLIIHDDRFYKRVLIDGTLGFGEAYMDGWWDSPSLDTVLYKLLSANVEKKATHNLRFVFQTIRARLFNRQSLGRAYLVSKRHYDLGNDLFECMLDKYMQYSCAYWKNAKTLEEAQQHKLELICRKLMLSPGKTVLDIGCGWGGFARYAAEKYQVQVTGITISAEQAALAKKMCAGLPVDIRLEDYRNVRGTYDRIVCIGMFEHVGFKNYPTFMDLIYDCLKPDGLFLLHCIGGNESAVRTDPWIDRYIFPNGMMPSIKQIGEALERRFIMQDWHNFGLDYDRTLMEWLKNFKAGWDKLKDKYDGRFYRMWEYYLCLSAASFRARKNHLWQIILSRQEYPGAYESVR